MTSNFSAPARRSYRELLNKVPEVTVWFWIIKVLATTVGETAADFLSDTLGLGLTLTTVIVGVALVAVLLWQFRAVRYVPGVYWLAVVLISIVGTLFTDNLVDGLGVPLQVTTVGFAVALAITFVLWFRSERTLSIHSITTRRRESFYWLAILFTFALGTAAGDLLAEGLAIGYLPSAALFAVCIALVAAAHYGLNLGAVLSFWTAYVLTRPLGASLGDYLSQPRGEGGLALGTVVTSAIFLVTILAVVIYLTRTRRDVIELHEPGATWSAEDDNDIDDIEDMERGRLR
jgi:uncharacterized membrane-anchored protein